MDPLRTSASDLRGMLNTERRSISPDLSGGPPESLKSQVRKGSAKSLDLDACDDKEGLLNTALRAGNIRAVKRLLEAGVRTGYATTMITEGANFPEERQVGAIKDVCKSYKELLAIISPPNEADQEVPDGE